MYLLIDIGNSTVVCAIAGNDGEITATWRFDTVKDQTPDYYIDSLMSGLESHGVKANDIEATAISSVVPEINGCFAEVVYRVTKSVPRFFTIADVMPLLNVDVENPEQVGKDRLADAVGAIKCYGCPVIIIDMGTATTIGIVDHDRKFVGGMIIPGVKTGHRALCKSASQLVEIGKWEAKHIVGRNTEECLQSGVIYGTACMIDGIIDRIVCQFGTRFNIVATGGMSSVIVPYCTHRIQIDKHLLLKGIYHAMIEHQKAK